MDMLRKNILGVDTDGLNADAPLTSSLCIAPNFISEVGMNYIVPGSHQQSFFEKGAIIGGRIALVMVGFAVMFLFIDLCIKAF